MRFLVLACALLLLPLQVMAVYYGQSREDVVKELGKPSSDLKRGSREVLIFKSGRVELEDGKVAVVKGIEVTAGPTEAGVAPGEPVKTAAVVPAAPEKKAEDTLAKEVETAENAAEERKMLEADAAARAKMEKEIEAMSNPVAPPPQKSSGATRWVSFTVELLIKGLMMLAALKLTAKYWSVEISWSGLAIAAAADTVARAVVGGAVLWALGMGSTLYADEAVGALVLVIVLRKVSYNQSMKQAVTITITSKTFSIVVGSFLSVFLTRLLFGGGGGGMMPF